MIRVPAAWQCARYDCLIVECSNKHVFLCRVVPLTRPATVYSLSAKVRVPADAARRLTTTQDVAESEEKVVQWLPQCDVGALWSYTICGAGLGASDELPTGAAILRIHCVSRTCMVQSMDCSGPRLDARATTAYLSSVLMGCFVLPGCVVDARHGRYQVIRIEKKSGSGPAMVGSNCRIRLNDGCFAGASVGRTPPCRLTGLDDAVAQLEAVVSMAEEGAGVAVGVLVHGPKGCGVKSLIEHCVRSRPGVELLSWSTSLDASFARRRVRGKVVVLYLPSCERFFPAHASELARLRLRKLQKDVALFSTGSGGHRPSVLVAASTHQLDSHCAASVLSFFSVSVGISLPDVGQRAALLSAVRGAQPADWMAEAQSLVGKTSAEVLSVARDGGWKHKLPFKEVRWSDIGGLCEVKECLHRALVWPQRHPEAFKKFNLSPPKGILLYGPPGCAKTTLVKALCSEGCFSLIYLDSANVVSAYVGESERLLRGVFEQASQRAPCIVFFDEVEVLGARREARAQQAGGARLLSTLLTEMDGFTASRGVCFVGATNAPHLIDSALLRPGRFDCLAHVPLPPAKDREEILLLCLSSCSVDANALATLTEGFSGADLGALCTTALLELLAGTEAPPTCLCDAGWMTSFMKDRIACFQRTAYDSPALEKFHREHASVQL